MNASEAREKAENHLRDVTSQVEELRRRRDSLNRIHVETTNKNLRWLFHREIETAVNRMREQIHPFTVSAGFVFSVSATPTGSRLDCGFGFSDQERADMEHIGIRCVEFDQFEAIIKKVVELLWKGDLDQYLQTYRIGAVQQVIYESLPTRGTIWNRILKSGPEPQYETRKMVVISLPPPPPPQQKLEHPLSPILVELVKIGSEFAAAKIRESLEHKTPLPEPKPAEKWVAVKGFKMPKPEDLPRAIMPKDESSPKPQPDKKEKEDSSNKEKT